MPKRPSVLRAEVQPKFEMVQVHEEKLSQLEGSVTRTSRDVNKSVEEVRGLVDSTEKQLAAKTAQVERKVLGSTEKLSKEIEQTRAQQRERSTITPSNGAKTWHFSRLRCAMATATSLARIWAFRTATSVCRSSKESSDR